MLFYFYKLVALLLLPPGIFIVLLALTAIYMYVRRSRGRQMVAVCAALIYLLSLPVTAQLLLRHLEDAYTPVSIPADAVIVLGGGAVQGTPAVSGSGNLGPYSASRLLTAMELASKDDLPIIVTGGQPFADAGNEGQIAGRVLRNLGFSDDKIIIEDKAHNTYENAVNTLTICKQRGIKRAYLVTSAWHMIRSMANFSKVYAGSGIELLPYPCDYQLSRGAQLNVFSLLPQMWALEANYMALHEYLGLLALKIL